MRWHVFSLCPVSHFAHERFRNCTAQSKNSYFARKSENSHFAQDNSGIVPILTLRRTCTSYFGSMNQYDPMFDLKINIGHHDLYSWSRDFALYLEGYLMYEQYYLGLWVGMTQIKFKNWVSLRAMKSFIREKFDLKINIGHYDLYSWSKDFALYLGRLFDVCNHTLRVWISTTRRLTYIPWSSDFALYLEDYLMHEHYYWDYESVWHKVLPQNKYRSLWPIFYGPVILHYILKTIWCMNIILWDCGSVWPDVWPQNKCWSVWHISWSSDFVFYLQDYLMHECNIVR